MNCTEFLKNFGVSDENLDTMAKNLHRGIDAAGRMIYGFRCGPNVIGSYRNSLNNYFSRVDVSTIGRCIGKKYANTNTYAFIGDVCKDDNNTVYIIRETDDEIFFEIVLINDERVENSTDNAIGIKSHKAPIADNNIQLKHLGNVHQHKYLIDDPKTFEIEFVESVPSVANGRVRYVLDTENPIKIKTSARCFNTALEHAFQTASEARKHPLVLSRWRIVNEEQPASDTEKSEETE